MHADGPPAQPLMTASPPARAETSPKKAKQRSKSQKKREKLAAATEAPPAPHKSPRPKRSEKGQAKLATALAAVLVAAGQALSPCAFLPIAVVWSAIGDIAITGDSLTYGRLGGGTDVSGSDYPVEDYCVGGDPSAVTHPYTK